MQSIQDLAHSPDHNYVNDSPHLRHGGVYQRLLGILRDVFALYEDDVNEPPKLLDVGAGSGSFDEQPLARGWSVTAVEMSRGAIQQAKDRFGKNPRFEALLDENEDMSVVVGRRFDVILYASVIHHIPDYLDAVDQAMERHLLPGGSLVTLQDPQWYPGQSLWVRVLTKMGYYSWRVFQGDMLKGLATITRRVRGVYDEANPSDMAEYHVVRQGVNQDELLALLIPRFQSVEFIPYWSTHAKLFQWIGDKAHLTNTFAITASGYNPDRPVR